MKVVTGQDVHIYALYKAFFSAAICEWWDGNAIWTHLVVEAVEVESEEKNLQHEVGLGEVNQAGGRKWRKAERMWNI